MVNEPLIGHMRLQWWRDAIDAFDLDKACDHGMRILRTVDAFINESLSQTLE